MRALLIALGNPLRRDEGVAQAALRMVGDAPDVQERALARLAPEVANDIGAYDTVVFLDADSDVKELRIEAVDEEEPPMPDPHTSRPAEIIALAREASSFAGKAFVCRIPAMDLSAGEGLSRRAKISARRAAAALEGLLREMRTAVPSSQPQILHAGG